MQGNQRGIASLFFVPFQGRFYGTAPKWLSSQSSEPSGNDRRVIQELHDFVKEATGGRSNSLIDALRTKILFSEKLNETIDSLNKMTLDEILWVNSQLEYYNLIDRGYQYIQEKKEKQRKHNPF